MFTPFDPNAGPTGGDGFAAPPLICNLMSPATSFAIFYLYLTYFFTFLSTIIFIFLSEPRFLQDFQDYQDFFIVFLF
jgi:hypothetical protein